MTDEFFCVWLPSILTGLATLLVAVTVRPWLHGTRKLSSPLFDEQIKNRLREHSLLYRILGEVVDAFAATDVCQTFASKKLKATIRQGGLQLPMSASQLVAMFALRCVLAFIIGLLLVLPLTSFAIGAAIGLVASIVLWYLQMSEISNRAKERHQRFAAGFPFAIDLAGIMMQAGADMRLAIETVASESAEEVVAEQFSAVQKDLRDGRSLPESLEELEQRIPTPVVNEFVTSLRKSEELGTPLSRVFLNQAEQMRIRHSQWVESVSGKAQVQISLPTMLIMIACMITICAPFLFGVISSG